MLREVVQIISWIPLITYLVVGIDLPFWDGLVVVLLAALVVATYLIAADNEGG